MQITEEQLLLIFKAAYRLGEAARHSRKGHTVISSTEEIEADAFPIIANTLNREFYNYKPRQGGKARLVGLVARLQKDLYEGVLDETI